MTIASKVSRCCRRRFTSRWRWLPQIEGFASHRFVMKDFEFHKALFLPDGKTQTVQVVLSLTRTE